MDFQYYFGSFISKLNGIKKHKKNDNMTDDMILSKLFHTQIQLEIQR